MAQSGHAKSGCDTITMLANTHMNCIDRQTNSLSVFYEGGHMTQCTLSHLTNSNWALADLFIV